MNGYITQANLEEFTNLLNSLNIVLKDMQFNQESYDVNMHGAVQKVRMPGRAEVEMTLIATPEAVNAFMELTKEIKTFNNIKVNPHPSVQDQYRKLLAVAALTHGDDNACEPG